MGKALRYTFFFVVFLTLFSRAHALSVGDIEAASTIGQPLEAVIVVEDRRSIAADQLLVSLAPRTVYDRMGVYWEYFHSGLNFEVEQAGLKRVLIRVTTKNNITEPYINFVLSVRWPDGLITKEYMLLLEMQQVVSGGGVSAEPTVPREQSIAGESAGADAEVPNEPASSVDEPAILIEPELPVQSAQVNSSAGSAAAQSGERQWRVQTRSGDTLWAIAKKIGDESGVKRTSVMNALYENNRRAFGQSVDYMLAGAVLEVSLSQLRAASPLTLPTKPQAETRKPSATAAESVASQPATEPPVSEPAEVPLAAVVEGGVLSVVTEQEEELLDAGLADLEGDSSSSDTELATVGLSKAGQELEEARLKAEAIEARLNSLMAQYDVLNEKTEKLKELEIELNRRIAEKAAAGIEPAAAAPVSVAGVGAVEPSQGFFANNRWLIITVLGLLLIGLAVLALTRVGRMVPAEQDDLDDASRSEDWDDTAFLNEKQLDDSELAEIVKLKGEKAFLENQSDVDDSDELLGDEVGNGVELQAAMFIAYERYDEAEQLINESLLENPDNTPLKLQLLEIFAARKDRMQFGMLANRLRELGDDQVNATIDALAQF